MPCSQPCRRLLGDPEQSRELLERSIRAAAPSYDDLRIKPCTPHVLSYKPGTRGTIRYDLEYPSDLAGRGWPEIVIGKTYRGNKGQIAYEWIKVKPAEVTTTMLILKHHLRHMGL